jgi:endonuclease YncB( thermonuclease family)
MSRLLAVSLLLVFGLGLGVAALPDPAYPSIWGTVVNVVDGNTIVVQIVGGIAPDWVNGSVETVRYLGSLADPADATVCGSVARQLNYQMTFGRLVYLELDQAVRDAEGAVLAYVYLDSGCTFMVNAALVAMGAARAAAVEPNTRYAAIFSALESTAAELGLGCLGTP